MSFVDLSSVYVLVATACLTNLKRARQVVSELAKMTTVRMWVALSALTLSAIVLSDMLTLVALWATTTGEPGAVVPEREIWINMILFSILILGIVCPLVTIKLLNVLRALHEARAQLAIVALQDPLTGLLNRRGFDNAANTLIAQASAQREQLVAFICDIDHFKRINDTYGHECGDEAIRHVAKLLQRLSTKDGDAVVGRQGGEEFAVVMVTRTVRDGVRVAENVRSTIAATPFMWDQAKIYLTVSVGVSLSPPTNASVRSLLSRADSALYQAKASGRNRVTHAPSAVAA